GCGAARARRGTAALLPRDGSEARGRRPHGARGTTNRPGAARAPAPYRPPAAHAADAPMTSASEAPRGLAGDCMVESAEGPVAMAETPNKGFAVLTRLPSGQLGFRQLIKVTTAGPVPLVRVVLET